MLAFSTCLPGCLTQPVLLKKKFLLLLTDSLQLSIISSLKASFQVQSLAQGSLYAAYRLVSWTMLKQCPPGPDEGRPSTKLRSGCHEKVSVITHFYNQVWFPSEQKLQFIVS